MVEHVGGFVRHPFVGFFAHRPGDLFGFFEDLLRDKFGVAPHSIPDYLALVGDSSDGFPGLPGWGAKSAAVVLARFEHLEAIPPSVLDWQVDVRNASRLSATLEDHRADALLYRRLATLNRDARIDDVTGSLDEMEWKGVPRHRFVALCEELGFDTVRERVHRWAD